MKLLHYDKMGLAWAVFIEVVAHGFFACAQPELLVGYQAARPTHQSLCHDSNMAFQRSRNVSISSSE
jgi:hypothetical protein